MLEQSSLAIKKMDDTIQSSASNAEESAAAAEEMSAQAMQMREIADQLTLLVYGSVSSRSGYITKEDNYYDIDEDINEPEPVPQIT
jgi:methyl-accepting chemotaxis protein